MRFSVAALLILLFGASIAPAQKTIDPAEQRAREAYLQLHDQLLDWARVAIVPQIRTWKARLDAAMEPADLQTLNALRARAAELNARRIAQTRGIAEAWRTGDREGVKNGGAALKALLPEAFMLLEELRPLGLKYRSTLEAIGADAKPKMKEWKTEGIARYASWLEANKTVLGEASSPLHKGGRRMGWLGKMNPEMRKNIGAAIFMLWDGGDLASQLGAEEAFELPALD